MKKIICVVILLLAFGHQAQAMIPGPPRVVECPKCGEEKKLLSLISGNTFGAVQWSDLYLEAPMLPRVSPVQKCHGCGGYFLLSKAKTGHSEDEDYSAETGRLSFEEIKEALRELEKDSLERDDEFALRMEFLHRYNDAFRNYDDETDDNIPNDFLGKRTKEDTELQRRNLKALIALLDETDSDDQLLMAELYREAGEFEKCINLMKAFKPNEEYEGEIVETEIIKAEAKDDKTFILGD